MWNSLSSRVVEAGSVEYFKGRLDVSFSSELLETIRVLIMELLVFRL